MTESVDFMKEEIRRLQTENYELKVAAANAGATILAVYQWLDRVEQAGGATSIEGVAACNAMLKSLRKNDARTEELVLKPIKDLTCSR